MTDEPMGMWRLIASDIRAAVNPEGKPRWRGLLEMVLKTAFSEKIHVVIRYRVSHVLWHWHLQPIALWLRKRSVIICGAEIHPRAEIGPGFFLTHTVGVGIASHTVAGKNLRMHHGSLIGTAGLGSRDPLSQPTLGDNVTVGAHALISGNVTIGDNAVVGANSFVTKDVPPKAVVGGVPAKFIRWIDPEHF